MIVGIDPGNFEVKVAGAAGLDRFSSSLGEFRERNIEQLHGKDDMIFEFNGRRGFAGSLAEAESEFAGTIMGDSKAHEDTVLRVLIALHRFGQLANDFQIVVGQPIGKHTPAEKQRIKEMLLGQHEITINGRKKRICISRVEVAAEGAAAFWGRPQNNLVRIIDIGSGTVNCASLYNKRYIDKDSFTLPFGVNTVKSQNFEEMARGIVTYTSKKWNKEDLIHVVGGGAYDITPYLKNFYPNARVTNPIHGIRAVDPVFANAVGYYTIGEGLYD